VSGFYYYLIAQAGITVNNWQHKVRYCPKNKNVVEIDSLQVYFQFSLKFYKNCYIWFVKPVGFATSKLHFATPFKAATHSLRSPALRHRPMSNSMKKNFAQQQSVVATPSEPIWSKPNVDTFFPVKITRNCCGWFN